MMCASRVCVCGTPCVCVCVCGVHAVFVCGEGGGGVQ